MKASTASQQGMTQGSPSKMQWAELVTTIGVLVSLIFVGLEVRQNTAVARAQARNDLASLSQEWLLAMAQDPTLNRAFMAYWLEALIGYGMRAPALAGLRFRTEFWPELRGEFDPNFVRFAESMWGMS